MTSNGSPQSRGRAAAAGVIAAVAVVAVVGAAALVVGSAVAMARTVVTPPKRKVTDVRVVAVDGHAHTVVLNETPDTIVDGEYSLWFDGDAGHARIGTIIARAPGTVTRRLLAVDSGELAAGRIGRIGAWFHTDPAEFDLPYHDVEVPTPLGAAPAWLFPAATETGRWVIQVHGRGVRREEGLRAVAPFRDRGYTSLLISYRNDTVAPPSPDGLYALGGMEWIDVESAIHFALDHGARELVLMGWSMGGALVLQTLARSRMAAFVRGVVLDSPVIDWVTTLEYHAELASVPGPVRRLALALLGSRLSRILTRQAQPIDFDALDFVARAEELDVPVLLLHSDDDGYVPSGPSTALAALRSDIVTYRRWTTARHTRLWNYDPDRWRADITEWLDLLGAGPSLNAQRGTRH